jgi:TatD DNase family protein
MIDTHAHVYLDEFKDDIDQVVMRSREAGIREIWLPAINAESLKSMDRLAANYPGYFRQFAGLHPEDVGPDFRQQLDIISSALDTGRYTGVGEIGLDLYWNKTTLNEQKEALIAQLNLATTNHLPVIIHVRDAFDDIMPIIRTYYSKGLKGIFHCFSGTLEQARELTETGGFLLGINGSITYKKSAQATFLNQIPLKFIVTETDSPYLPPVPYRGKRNEPRNIIQVIQTLSVMYGLSEAEVRTQCLSNASSLIS